MANRDNILDEVFFSVDGEFDGPYPPAHSMLSVGVVAFTLRRGVRGEWSANIEPLEGAIMDPKVKREFWDKNPDAYAATLVNQQDPYQAMYGFRDFYRQFVTDRAGTFVEYPGPSDFFWCHWYFNRFLGENPFGHSGQLGMKTYSAAVLKKPLRHSNKRNMPKRWFSSKLPHTHIALDDARQQGHMAIRMMCEHLELPLPPL